MSSDLDQFHTIFFEESLEGLDMMESGLLNLQPGQADKEEIDAIFRVAHSVKGGSGMFGFTEIMGLTHILETMLDEMRDGKREVSKSGVDLLLRSVDCLREMLENQKNEQPQNQKQIADIQKELVAFLADGGDTASEPKALTTGSAEADSYGWKINFVPHESMLRTGNDPLLMFKVLEMSGALTTQVDLSRLPTFADLDPEACFLSWQIHIEGGALEEISEVFDWVEDECELEITPLTESVANVDDATPPVPSSQTGAITQSGQNEASHPEDDSATGISQAAVPPDRRDPSNDRRQTDRRSTNQPHEAGSIRVNTDKIDTLINMVGELVITQSMLSRFNDESTEHDMEMIRDGLDQLERNTRELQESVMQIRMLPISFSFNRFPRLVRDICSTLSKKAELVLVGEQTEVDKTVLEKISDPLVHLVRNSLDHGLETPEARVAAGKTESGTLLLNAFHEGGSIVIEISDDGAGLNREKILEKAREKGLVGEREELPDEQIYNLIFRPGFSTADSLSDLSGRGVGMDVVRRNIRDLGGTVSITSDPGLGSTVTIRLPLTMAILDGQLIKVGAQNYVVSLISIIESLQVDPQQLSSVNGQAQLFKLRDEYIPIIRLHELFRIDTRITELTEGLLVVVESDNRKVGLFVDELLGQQQVVIKSLETNFRQVQGVSGATILGDGRVALILDVAGLIQSHFRQRTQVGPTANIAA